MMRRGPLVIALLVLLSLGTVGVVANGTFVSMTAESVPDQPTADSAFAVDVHFESASGGETTYDIRDVRLYDEDGDRIATKEAAPPIGPGDSHTVRIDDVELDEPGVHDLRAEATLAADGTEHVVETDLQVEVFGTEPAMGLDVEPAGADAWRTVNLTLANRNDEAVRGIDVGVEADDVDVRPDERVVSALAPGEERTVSFEARSSRIGTHDLDVSVSYRNADGDVRSVERTVAADFAAPDVPSEARLTDVNVTATETGLRIDGAVVNDGEGAIDGTAVAVADREGANPTAPSPEAYVGSVPAGDRSSFAVTASIDDDRETIPLAVTYRVDGVERTLTQEIAYDGPGSIRSVEVSDLSVVPTAGGVRINGSAANVGTQDATGVSVAVREEPGVRPVSPQSGAFVGAIARGESAPFDLTAALDDDRETIPLAVSYAIDGTTYELNTSIPYEGERGVHTLELTGVSATPTGDGLELEGSASNVGATTAESVVVAVGDGEGVAPTAPQPEYFVGTVDGSDFASFAVTANVEGNRTTVPLVVQYTIDGVTYEATESIEVDPRPAAPDQSTDDGGGFPLVPVIVGLVVVGLAAVAYRRLR